VISEFDVFAKQMNTNLDDADFQLLTAALPMASGQWKNRSHRAYNTT
jgi:hypothetical protein